MAGMWAHSYLQKKKKQSWNTFLEFEFCEWITKNTELSYWLFDALNTSYNWIRFPLFHMSDDDLFCQFHKEGTPFIVSHGMSQFITNDNILKNKANGHRFVVRLQA